MINFNFIKKCLQQHYGLDELDLLAVAQSGGDIHQSFTLRLGFAHIDNNDDIPQHLFAKVNSGFSAHILESEFKSLKIINSIYPDYYPQALLFDRSDDHALLLMSFHNLTSFSHADAADAGRALAAQHRISNDSFGWSSDNYIGLTPQSNQWHESWVTFFQKQRLVPMIKLAKNQGLPTNILNRIKLITDKLDELLTHSVTPSLVHGDLWSGNLSFDLTSQQALFYDPAPYFGDREVDLAMTEFFGRQPESFYQAYQQAWPLAPGYQQRRAVYNLYHALNHVVLFGASYHGFVESCLDQITSRTMTKKSLD